MMNKVVHYSSIGLVFPPLLCGWPLQGRPMRPSSPATADAAVTRTGHWKCVLPSVYPSIPSRLITEQQKVAEHIRISDAVTMTTSLQPVVPFCGRSVKSRGLNVSIKNDQTNENYISYFISAQTSLCDPVAETKTSRAVIHSLRPATGSLAACGYTRE